MNFIVKYWNYFHRYVGSRMFLLMLIAPVVGILDGIGISLLIPVFTGFLADSGEIESNSFTEMISSVFDFFGLESSPRNLLICAVILIFFKSLLRLIHVAISASLNSKLMARLRTLVINNFSGMKYINYVSLNTGYVLNTAVSDVARYASAMIAFLESINTLFILLGYGLAILMLSWKTTLYLIVFGALVSFIYAYFNKRSKKFSRGFTTNNKEYAKHLIELVNFFKYLKATSGFTYLNKKLTQNVKSLRRLSFLTETNRAMPSIVQEPLSIILVVGLFLVNSWLLGETVSVMIIVLGIAYRMNGVVSQFQSRKQNFFALIGSLESVTVMLDNLDENKEKAEKPNAEVRLNKEIRLEKVSFSYGEDGDKTLDEINLTIRKNETVAFVGASGAGKSTLIDILSGLLSPESGKIYIDDVPYDDLCMNAWRRHLGYVTQESIIFDSSVMENITLSEDRNALNQQNLENAIDWSNSREFIERNQDALEAQLGDKGTKLSGGQKQRISLARELYKSPDLLILDEATSALDSNSEKLIKESLEFMKGKTTLIMIAHRLTTIKHADRIFLLHNGKIAEEGNYKDLMGNPNSLFYDLASHQNL